MLERPNAAVERTNGSESPRSWSNASINKSNSSGTENPSSSFNKSLSYTLDLWYCFVKYDWAHLDASTTEIFIISRFLDSSSHCNCWNGLLNTSILEPTLTPNRDIKLSNYTFPAISDAFLMFIFTFWFILSFRYIFIYSTISYRRFA